MRLKVNGVDYLFGNAGTDFAPVIEAYANAPLKNMPVGTARHTPRVRGYWHGPRILSCYWTSTSSHGACQRGFGQFRHGADQHG